MSLAAKLVLIVFGYAAAVAVGVLAVMVDELFTPADVSQASGGMVAFGDLVLFLCAAGLAALVPSRFLLRLLTRR